MSEYTPSTPDVEVRYIRFRELEASIWAHGVSPHQPGEFKRWYEAEIREAKAEALREAAEDINGQPWLFNGPRTETAAQSWLLDRADQIQEAA